MVAMKFWIIVCCFWSVSLSAQVIPNYMYPFAPAEVLIPLKQGGAFLPKPFNVQCQYQDSLLHGPIKVFWQDSTLMAEFEMDNGRFIGQYKTYYSDGSLYEKGFLDGSLELLKCNQTLLRDHCYISSNFEYVSYNMIDTVTVYLQGGVDSASEVVSSTSHTMPQKSGVIMTYWPNGHLKKNSCFLDGERFGHQARYDSLGKLNLLRYIDYDRYYVIEAWEDGNKVVENGFGNITEEVYLGYRYREKGTIFFFEDYKLCIVAVPNGNGGFVLWNNN